MKKIKMIKTLYRPYFSTDKRKNYQTKKSVKIKSQVLIFI